MSSPDGKFYFIETSKSIGEKNPAPLKVKIDKRGVILSLSKDGAEGLPAMVRQGSHDTSRIFGIVNAEMD